MFKTQMNCSLQVRQFFRDYLEDISRLIQKIKSNIFQLVNIQNFINQHNTITTELASIYQHCKETFYDLKQINLVLENYINPKFYNIHSPFEGRRTIKSQYLINNELVSPYKYTEQYNSEYRQMNEYDEYEYEGEKEDEEDMISPTIFERNVVSISPSVFNNYKKQPKQYLMNHTNHKMPQKDFKNRPKTTQLQQIQRRMDIAKVDPLQLIKNIKKQLSKIN